MNRAGRAAALLLILAAGSAVAQPPAPEPASLRGDSAQTRKRLTEAEQKLAANQPADAIDALQRILDEAGDDLVTADGRQYQPARRFVHQILARLPADALKGYQDRLDGPAKKLLDSAKQNRDVAPLWQLFDRYFVSRPADEGLLLLGDLLFEQGDFRVAEQVWRMLLPDEGSPLVYPNSKADPAAVRARLILATIFAGDTDRAKLAYDAFKAKHADAKGPFAGKVGKYADTLQSYLDKPPRLPPAANRGTDWPTFAGGPDRGGRLAVRLPSYWPTGRPSWSEIFPQPTRHAAAPTLPPARPPFGYPVIANGRAFVTDGSRVFGYDLATGKALTLPTAFVEPPIVDPLKPAPPDGSPSLTAVGDRLYLRVGSQLVRPPDAGKGGKGSGECAIVCLGPGEAASELKECWRLPPPGEGKAATVWEGPPLVAGRRMWTLHARFEGGRVVHGISCYDPADAATAPPLAWSHDVCDSPLPTGGDPRARQELLTLAGRNVVFCSNNGAVVALDAISGKRAWGFRYPRSRKGDASRSPDPSPAVFACGRVFVAPVDADRVYALDPESGQVLWESGTAEGTQILGVAGGRLIVTVTGPARGMRALDLATGSSREPDGWVLHDTGGLLSYGRGFVTDDAIVWPTRNGLFFIDPVDGRLLGPPFLNHLGGESRRYFGNLAYADGVLVVVSATQIWGFVTEAKRFGKPGERSERDPLRLKFEALIEKAEAALANGEAASAREALMAATVAGFSKPLRAWAAARLLLLTPRTEDEAKLPADLRAAITPELRSEWLIPPDGIPATLGTLVLRHTGREATLPKLPSSPLRECERLPEEPPSLAPDAEITRTVRLQPNSMPLHWLPGPVGIPKRMFTTNASQLFAVSLTDGDDSRHDVADSFTHAADLHDGFVVAGPLAVAVYASDRAPVWVFRVPETEPLPKTLGQFRLALGVLPPPELSGFRLTGTWLVARLGERHLIAFDLKGRRVAWVLGTNGKPGYQPFAFPDAVRFGLAFATTNQLIVVQLSDGRRWFVRIDSGKILDVPGFDQPTTRVWWSLPPAEVDGNRLAVSDGPGLVRLLNLSTGRVRWAHQEERDASLTGLPPQVRAWGDTLIVATSRNHGVELERLNLPDGLAVWKAGPAFLDAARINLANSDADADRVYVSSSTTLSAFTLKDGKVAWEAELPDLCSAAGWVVKAGQRCVIAYPSEAIPREQVANVLERVTRSFRNDPQALRLPGLVAGLYDAWVTRSVPVLLFDLETGKRLNTIEVPALGPTVTACFASDVAVVATGDRVVWFR
ncbi:MAG: hypothetical protein C0467_21025 [Planctomycetaceae bacterium]|nr:hypothetical protein [Planctomycetaceae bacterium]